MSQDYPWIQDLKKYKKKMKKTQDKACQFHINTYLNNLVSELGNPSSKLRNDMRKAVDKDEDFDYLYADYTPRKNEKMYWWCIHRHKDQVKDEIMKKTNLEFFIEERHPYVYMGLKWNFDKK